MTIVAGEFGGMVFRVDSTHAQFYCLRIGQDGSYEIDLHAGSLGSGTQVLKSGASLAIKAGLNQSNLIAVVVSGSDIDLYVNHQHIAYISDSSYSQGQLGVFAESSSQASGVVYKDVSVWAV
jgi:lipid-binding SYLF domain-containing protein